MMNCWWYKKKLQLAETVSADVQRHLNQCPDCRQLFEQRVALESRLRCTAPETQQQTPPYFLNRVAETCQKQSNYAYVEPARFGWKVGIAAATGLCVAVGIAVAVYRMDHVNDRNVAKDNHEE